MKVNIMGSDIAPRLWRKNSENAANNSGMVWEGTNFSVWGNIRSVRSERLCLMKVQGKLLAHGEVMPGQGWIELETAAKDDLPSVDNLYLVGTRPLPVEDVICICRHPATVNYFLAATTAAELLWLDAKLSADLKIVCRQILPGPLAALICCGKNLLGLELLSPSGSRLHLIGITESPTPSSSLRLLQSRELPFSLVALAENDHSSVWGLSASGELYRLLLEKADNLKTAEFALKHGRLAKRNRASTKQIAVQALHQDVRLKSLFWHRFHFKPEYFSGLAYDGRNFWSSSRDQTQLLRLHEADGTLVRSYNCHAAVSIYSLSYCHNNLLILDRDHQQLHLYHLTDTMQPAAALKPAGQCHPGYLAAGSPDTAGMHEMCLLYAGAADSQNVHRYDSDKLLPLLGYLSPQGEIKDCFMDGFLMLAQYSPLLNGRSFGLDLCGPPSRREDWLALFDEYFYPQANLAAMNKCLEEISRILGPDRCELAKVVIAIPTADPRCLNWDNEGYSLGEEKHRLEVTRWAMQEVVKRWHQAAFRHLRLVGFYYMTEQGLYDDRLLHCFPAMCRQLGLRSFAIPGITSSWITEFNRAGFDSVVLQPSHSFSQPDLRHPYQLLKCAGRIAREYGMGMEVELPYEVLEPSGRHKLRDYLRMAAIQGWAGAFTAYFQSYNLIKSLCESENRESRQLYDDLFLFTRLSRHSTIPSVMANMSIFFNCQAEFDCGAADIIYRLNIEKHQGSFHLQKISVSASIE
jgi:hypothetical protein